MRFRLTRNIKKEKNKNSPNLTFLGSKFLFVRFPSAELWILWRHHQASSDQRSGRVFHIRFPGPTTSGAGTQNYGNVVIWVLLFLNDAGFDYCRSWVESPWHRLIKREPEYVTYVVSKPLGNLELWPCKHTCGFRGEKVLCSLSTALFDYCESWVIYVF